MLVNFCRLIIIITRFILSNFTLFTIHLNREGIHYNVNFALHQLYASHYDPPWRCHPPRPSSILLGVVNLLGVVTFLGTVTLLGGMWEIVHQNLFTWGTPEFVHIFGGICSHTNILLELNANDIFVHIFQHFKMFGTFLHGPVHV